MNLRIISAGNLHINIGNIAVHFYVYIHLSNWDNNVLLAVSIVYNKSQQLKKK